MQKYKDVTKFLGAVANALLPFFKKRFARISTGKVVQVSGKTVVVNTDVGTLTAQRYCSCKAGDTVLVVRQGSAAYATGVRQ